MEGKKKSKERILIKAVEVGIRTRIVVLRCFHFQESNLDSMSLASKQGKAYWITDGDRMEKEKKVKK